MPSQLVNDLMASYNDYNAGGGYGPQQQKVDISAAAQWLISQNDPQTLHNWFRDEQLFARGWQKDDGTNYEIPVEKFWDEIVDQKKTEYMNAVADEAYKAEIRLFPGMLALIGEAVTYPVRHPIKFAKGVADRAVGLAAEAYSDPYGVVGDKDISIWQPTGGRQPQFTPDEAIAAPKPKGSGTDEMPLSYRLMSSYFDSYERLTEVEAELVNALAKQRRQSGEVETFGPALSTAIGSVGANAVAAAANPVGRGITLAGKITGMTVKGLVTAGAFLLGARGMNRVLRGTVAGEKVAQTTFGKTLNLLTGVGRGAHPAVEGMAVAQAIGAAELKAARIVPGVAGELRLPTTKEITLSITKEFMEAEQRRIAYIESRRVANKLAKQGTTSPIPQHFMAPKPFRYHKLPYLTDAQMNVLRTAAAADNQVRKAGLGHLVPTEATGVYNAVRNMVLNEDIGRHLVEPTLAKKARIAGRHLREFAEATGQKTVLGPAIKEAERIAAATAKDAGKRTWRIPSIFEPVWKMTGTAREAYRIAGNFVHNQQLHMLDVGVTYQRLKEALPDVKVRQDMIAFMEESPNPWRIAKEGGDTYEQVVQRLKDSGSYEQALWWKKYLRERFDNLFREMNELNAQIGGEAYEYQKNWLHHMWDEPVKEAEAKLGKIPHYELPVRHSSERPRFYNTYYEGMTKAGLTPRTDDIAVMYGLMEQQLSRVLATKKLVKELNQFGMVGKGLDKPAFIRLGKGQKIPDGYQTFRSAFTDRILSEEIPEKVRRNSTVYIHDDVAKHLRNILEQPTELDGLTGLSAIAKRSNFMFTLFHMYSLAESSAALLGRKAPRVNYNLFRHNFIGKGTAWADGEGLAHLLTTNSYREAFTKASEAGVILGAPMNDIMADQFSEFVNRLASKVPTVGGKRAAKGTVKKVLQMQDWFDTAIWSRYHTPMKVIAYDIMLDNLTRMRDTGKAGMGRFLPDKLRWMKRGLEQMDDEQLSRAVASYINDEFGSQNFTLHTRGWFENWLSRPKNLRLMNAAFTSVDWNASAIRASLGFTQAIPGLRHSNPARGIMGIRHWRNAVTGWAFYANIMNKVLSGHYIWENEPGKKVFYVDTGQRDQDGRPIYWHIGKQFREIGTALGTQPALQAGGPKGYRPGYHGMQPYLHDDGAFALTFIGRKAMPWIQVPWQTAMDLQLEKAKYLREGKEMGWSDSFLIAVDNAVTGVTPFSAGSFRNPALRNTSWDQRLVLGLVGTMLPLSKGYNNSTITAMMAEALRKEDYQRFNQIILDIAQSRGSKVASDLAAEARRLALSFPEGSLIENPLAGAEQPVVGPEVTPTQRFRSWLKGD